MALSGVMGAVGGNATNLLIRRDLVQQFWQDRRVTNVAACALAGPDLQRFFVDADMYLAPDAAFGATVLAGVPLAFTFGLDAGAVDEQVQRTRTATIGDAHIQRSLTAAQGSEVRHRPVQAN